MKPSVFDYTNYKLYLHERIAAEKGTRGLKLRIAEYVQCQASYLSLVLNGTPDFTLEQAQRINKFFHHSEAEASFFVLLVCYARAGTQDLKDLFEMQMKEIQKTRYELKRRIETTEDIAEKDKHKYYSAWFYSAIHVALSVPGLQSVKRLSETFHLPEELVKETMDFLEETGLVEKQKNTYRVTKRRVYLNRDSDFIRRHHINWRSQVLQSVEKNLPEDLHYSSVIAMSDKDYKKIKDIFLNAIEESRKVVGPSKEENVYVITTDIFRYKE